MVKWFSTYWEGYGFSMYWEGYLVQHLLGGLNSSPYSERVQHVLGGLFGSTSTGRVK